MPTRGWIRRVTDRIKKVYAHIDPHASRHVCRCVGVFDEHVGGGARWTVQTAEECAESDTKFSLQYSKRQRCAGAPSVHDARTKHRPKNAGAVTTLAAGPDASIATMPMSAFRVRSYASCVLREVWCHDCATRLLLYRDDPQPLRVFCSGAFHRR